jgi:hypothetical protein
MPSTVGALFPSTGNREDLLDIISVVDAKNTPISSSVAKIGADLNNPGLFSYQADSYNTPSFDGVVDSADVSDYDDPTKNRVLLSARSQKFRRTIRVSDFQQNIQDVAGVGKRKEMARGTARAITELKRDCEAAFSSDNDSQEGSGSAAYKLRGLGSWVSSSAQTDLPVPASQRTPSGSIDNTSTSTLTESKLQDVLQSIYQQTGTTDRLVAVVGPTLKKAITNFTRFTVNATSNVFNLRQTAQQASSDRLVSNISFYEGDFSSVEIVPSLLLAAGASTDAEKFARGYIVNPDHLLIRYGRRPAFRELEDAGGGPRGIIDCIVSIAALTPRAMGKLNATS